MSAVRSSWWVNVAAGAVDVCRTEQTGSIRCDARFTVQAVAGAATHDADDGREIHFIRLKLRQSRAGFLNTRLQPQGWLGLQLPRLVEICVELKGSSSLCTNTGICRLGLM